MLSLGSALGVAALGKGVGASSLASLFANGEDGFLFYPMSDMTRLFLLSSGSTGNAAVDADPVGLDLDSHSWGSLTLAQELAAQTELVTNGTFDANITGWTDFSDAPGNIAWDSGMLRLSKVSGTGARAQQGLATVVGTTYRLAWDTDSTWIARRVGSTAGGADVISSLGSSAGTNVLDFVALSTTSYLRFTVTGTGDASATLDNVTLKAVPGNHALQATTTKRPLWNANSGKPYLSFDGTDDIVVPPFTPKAAGTMAAAFNGAALGLTQGIIGGGATTNNTRAYLVIGSDNRLTGQCGSTAPGSSPSVVAGSDQVGLITYDSTSVDLYLNGVLVATAVPTTVPDGGGGGLGIGGLNANNSPGSFMNGRIYAALAMNRRVTPAEIALITSKFQGAYQ